MLQTDDKEPVIREGYTVLHELAVQTPQTQIEDQEVLAWKRMVEALTAPEIWSGYQNAH